MATRLYRVFDETTEFPGPIFEASRDEVAISVFKSLYPVESVSEYSLYCIGEFSNENYLSICSFSEPIKLFSGVDVFKALEDEHQVAKINTEVKND